MTKQLIGFVVASAVVLPVDAALATCNPTQVEGIYSLAGLLTDNATAISFRCPSFVVFHNSANKYNVNAACVAYRPAAGTVPYNIGGTGTLVVNPTTCKGSGSFTVSHNLIPATTTILQWQFQSPGTGPVTMANAVVRVGADTAAITFTLDR